MKKIAIMFLGALLSFMVLAHVGQYENLILPLIAPSESSFAGPSEREKKEVLKIIRDFNDVLAVAYLKSDSNVLPFGAIGENLRSSIAGEINYLTREGKVMDLRSKDIKIEKIEALSSNLIRATTKETVVLRYLSLSKGTEEIRYPETQYNVAYTLTMAGNKWKITNYETKGIKEQKL